MRDLCLTVTLRNGAEMASSFRQMDLRGESDHGTNSDLDSEETSFLQNDFTWKPCVGKMMSMWANRATTSGKSKVPVKVVQLKHDGSSV